LFVVLLLVPLVLDEAAATARLADVQATFTRHAKSQSMQSLAQLADAAPQTTAGARAAEWLGDLSRSEHDDAQAARYYACAFAGRDPRARTLAARGLGNIALDRGHYAEAIRDYSVARAGASSPQLVVELDLRLALARRLHWRALAEWTCWLFVFATVLSLLAQSRFWRTPRPAIPLELLYIAPVYVLLIGACIGRDPKVLCALWLIAGWSALLVGSAGLAAARVAIVGRHRLVRALWLATATVALFYAATNRAGVIDSMVFTVTT
jgi:hypothetical protein